jgi:hypothetical protein
MKDRLEAFLSDLDRYLAGQTQGEVLEIYPIGRSALVWNYDYNATTQDFDFLRPKNETPLLGLALQAFGKGTPKSREHGLYLEVVESAFPPMARGYEKRATPVAGPWKVVRLYRLESHDLVVSKLRRFSAKDRADVRLLCDLGHIDPVELEKRLEEAFPFGTPKDGDEYRDSAFRSLQLVQRYLRHEIREL